MEILRGQKIPKGYKKLWDNINEKWIIEPTKPNKYIQEKMKLYNIAKEENIPIKWTMKMDDIKRTIYTHPFKKISPKINVSKKEYDQAYIEKYAYTNKFAIDILDSFQSIDDYVTNNIDGAFEVKYKSMINGEIYTFKFNHIEHFISFIDSVFKSYVIKGETSENIAVIEENEPVLKLVKIMSIRPIKGGCNKHKATKKEIKNPFYIFNVVNTTSQNNNCFFRSLEYLINKKLDVKNLRKQFNIKTNEMVSIKKAFEIMTYLEYNYDIITPECDQELNPLNKYIMLADEHYMPVETITQVKNVDKKTKRGLMCWDIETRNTEKYEVIKATGKRLYQLADTISMAYYKEYKSEEFKHIYTETDDKKSSVRKFIDFLNSEAVHNRAYNIIAHNGSRFDYYFLISSFTKIELLDCDIQFRGSSIICIKYKGNIFRDSCCFLTNTLSNLCSAKNFNIEQGKITKMLLHGEEITNEQLCFYKPKLKFNEFMELKTKDNEYWELYKKYCLYDCIALYEVWTKFSECVNSLIKAINPTLLSKCPLNSCNTIGSHCKNIITRINKERQNPNKYKLLLDEFVGVNYDFELTKKPMSQKVYYHYENNTQFWKDKLKYVYCKMIMKDYDKTKYEFICNFKRGGISHCNKAGLHKNGIVGGDIASQYPASMVEMFIPCGKSFWVNDYKKEYHGFYELKNLKFNSGHKFKPVAISNKNISLNWNSENIEHLFIDTYMLEYLVKNFDLCDYEIVKGLVSYEEIKGDLLFGKYINTFYGEKKRQDSIKDTPEYNEAIRTTIKLYLNSLSGKLVEDPARYFTPKLFTKKEYDTIEQDKNEFKKIYTGKKYEFNNLILEKQDKGGFNEWVIAGVMVYSYSKRLLFEYINCLPSKSCDVIHVETDGIYFDSRLYDQFNKNLINYEGDYPCKWGDELGNLKVEKHTKEGEKAYFLGKKFYCITSKKENIYRIKGIPTKTINEYGEKQVLVDLSLYEKVYEGQEIIKEFSALKKQLFGERTAIFSHKMTRTIKPNEKYNEY